MLVLTASGIIFFKSQVAKIVHSSTKTIICAGSKTKIPDSLPIPSYVCENSNTLTRWVANIQQAKLQIVREESDFQNLLCKNAEVSKTLGVC